jgi:hypothetical protein
MAAATWMFEAAIQPIGGIADIATPYTFSDPVARRPVPTVNEVIRPAMFLKFEFGIALPLGLVALFVDHRVNCRFGASCDLRECLELEHPMREAEECSFTLDPGAEPHRVAPLDLYG